MSRTQEICPICRKFYSKRNPKVVYHLQYSPIEKYIYACKSCNYAEYLSRHWLWPLSFWQWKKISIVRRFAKENPDLIFYKNIHDGKRSKRTARTI